MAKARVKCQYLSACGPANPALASLQPDSSVKALRVWWIWTWQEAGSTYCCIRCILELPGWIHRNCCHTLFSSIIWKTPATLKGRSRKNIWSQKDHPSRYVALLKFITQESDRPALPILQALWWDDWEKKYFLQLTVWKLSYSSCMQTSFNHPQFSNDSQVFSKNTSTLM